MPEENLKITDQQAIQNRNDFLNNFKKTDRFNNALKHGFIGITLASITIGITAATLIGTGTIIIPFITLPLFAPVIAGIIGAIIVSFLAGAASRYLYTPSQVYIDFYSEFEFEKDKLLIDTNKKNLEQQNFISQNLSIKKWESRFSENKTALLLWKDENKFKNRYKEKIFQAITNNEEKRIRQLYNLRFRNYINDEHKNSFLYLLAENGYTKLTEELLKNKFGAINTTENEYLNALLCEAVSFGETEIVKILLQNGANINTKNQDGETLLYIATFKDHLETAEILLQNGADVNAKNGVGSTPLHIAAFKDHFEITKILLQNGADVNAKNEDGEIPLHEAIYNGNIEIVLTLINSGADIYAKDEAKQTENSFDSAINAQEYEIAFLITEEIVKREQIFNDVKNDKLTKLQIIDNYLLRIKDKYGNSLLHVAAINNNIEICKDLIKKGVDINAKNRYGDTPLHLAVSADHEKIIKILIENGANINAIDADGYTPVRIAGNKANIIKLLHSNKSNLWANKIKKQLSKMRSHLSFRQ